jgi:hypothetical protein
MVFTVVISLAFIMNVGPASAITYKNCTQLNARYMNGIASSSAVAKRQKFKPSISASLYKKYIKLDKDRDGTVCEKVSAPRSVVVVTTVPIIAVSTTLATASKTTPTVPLVSSTTPASTTTTIPGSFGSGKKAIGGSGIAPGRYMTLTASSCYWERLRDFSGNLSGIIANDNSSGSHVIVDISSSDVGFNSSRCGTWFPFAAKPPSSISDGVWSVGDEMQAGTWSATFTTSCYWARLSGFGGTLEEILANDNETSSAIVQIQPGDIGFLASRCGVWTKIG